MSTGSPEAAVQCMNYIHDCSFYSQNRDALIYGIGSIDIPPPPPEVDSPP